MSVARSPFGKTVVWVLSAGVVFGLPATSWIYWPAVGQSGVLSPDADTVMIPMMGDMFVALILAPIVCVVTWLCLRKNKHAGDLLAWDRAKPIRSSIVTILFGIPFFIGLSSLVDEFGAPPGWYGLWWLPYTLMSLLWLAVMRGSALSKPNGS